MLEIGYSTIGFSLKARGSNTIYERDIETEEEKNLYSISFSWTNKNTPFFQSHLFVEIVYCQIAFQIFQISTIVILENSSYIK